LRFRYPKATPCHESEAEALHVILYLIEELGDLGIGQPDSFAIVARFELSELHVVVSRYSDRGI